MTTPSLHDSAHTGGDARPQQQSGHTAATAYTPDWPTIVDRLSADLEEEREARKAWRLRAQTAEATLARAARPPGSQPVARGEHAA